jgi:hypothetical protein
MSLTWFPGIKYEFGVSDDVFYQDQKCAFIKCTGSNPYPGLPLTFGELSQGFDAKHYRNKRMRFSAAVKSQVVDMSAGLLMMVEGTCGQLIAYDDMSGRNITGTRDWERYKIVLDVPEETTHIIFGIRASGNGEVWMSSIKFEETKDEPTADPLYAPEPRNLDFSE